MLPAETRSHTWCLALLLLLSACAAVPTQDLGAGTSTDPWQTPRAMGR